MELNLFFSKIEHKIFYLKLKTLISQTGNQSSEEIVSEKNCSLSKFIQEQNLNSGQISDEYKKLIKIHKEIHESAKKIIVLKNDKNTHEALTQLKLLKGKQDEMMNLLSIIEEDFTESQSETESQL